MYLMTSLMLADWLLFTELVFDEGDFFGFVGLSVGAEDFVEPDRRLAIGVGMLPRVPRQKRLRLAGDQAPVDGAYVIFLGDRQRAFEGAAVTARHIFRANDRAFIAEQIFQAAFESFRLVVTVERDHIGLLDLDFFRGIHFFRRRPIVV